MSKPVVILGGGASGLLLAYALTQQKIPVEIHEKTDHWGGLIRTDETPWGLVESAANGFIFTAEVEELFHHLGLTLLPTQKKFNARYIFRGGRARRLPLFWREVPKFILFIVKFLFFRKSAQPQKGETLKTWGERNLGARLTDGVLAPAMYGVYNLLPGELSATLVLSSLFNRNVKKGSRRGTVAPARGMGELVEKLVSYLQGEGVQMHLRSSPAVVQGDFVLCVSTTSAALYLKNSYPQVAERMASLRRLGIVSVTQFFEPSPSDLRGFGVLFRRGEGQARGRLFNSDIFFERHESYRSETSIFSEEALLWSDEELFRACAEDRKKLGMEEKPLHSKVYRWPLALPAYDLALERFIDESLPQVSHCVFGNFTGGIGLSKILTAAHQFAEKAKHERLQKESQ